MAISDLVELTITIQDSAPKVPSFSTILVLTYNAAAGMAGMQTFDTGAAGLAALVTAGLTTKHDAYRKLAAISDQVPGVSEVKFFTRAAANAQTITLTPTVTTAGHIYGPFAVNGTDVTYTVPGSATVASICAELTTLIDAIADVGAVDSTTHVTVTPSASAIRVYIDDCPRSITLKDTSTDAGIATDLGLAFAADPDFYGVLIDSMGEAEINAAAAWCLSNKRMGFFQTADSIAWTSSTTDVLSDLNGLSNHYAAIFATRSMSGQACAALPGKLMSYHPGSATWANKTLEGVPADDWTGAEQGFIEAKKGLAYVDSADSKHTLWGWASSGRFIDLTHGTDWLSAIMKSAVVKRILDAVKIPYNLIGRAMIQQPIESSLANASAKGLIETGWIVTPPDLALVSDLDRTNRLMPDFTFSGVFTGAVHKVQVSGTLKA